MSGCSRLTRRRFRRDPTHALFADQSHSFPDNLVALLGGNRAWNYSAETARSAVGCSTCSGSERSTEQVSHVVIRPAGDGSPGERARVRGVRLLMLTCHAAAGPAQPEMTQSGPRSELEVGLVRASLLAHGSRRGLETTRQAVDVPGAPTGPGSRSPRSRDRGTEPRTALPWRRVIPTPAICRARAAGRSRLHSAGAGRQPIRMIGLNGSRPSRQMRGWSI